LTIVVFLEEVINNTEDENKKNLRKIVLVSVSAALGMLLLAIYFFYRFWRSIVGKTILPFSDIFTE